MSQGPVMLNPISDNGPNYIKLPKEGLRGHDFLEMVSINQKVPQVLQIYAFAIGVRLKIRPTKVGHIWQLYATMSFHIAMHRSLSFSIHVNRLFLFV